MVSASTRPVVAARRVDASAAGDAVDERRQQPAGARPSIVAPRLQCGEDVQPIGRRRWAIAEGYIPGWSHGLGPQMTSHEAVCLLNVSDREAHVEITLYFTDREPVGPYRVTVAARRTLHVRFNDLVDPEPVQPGREYASLIEADVPIVAQHTRLDSRQAENALMTTMAYGED
jgi:hypothetical protein